MPGMQIKVLDKAVEIMELLATSGKGVRLKDAVEALKLNKTTALRILRVLESHHLAARNGDSAFVLGNRVLWWEACYRRKFELLEVVRPYLEKVRDLTSETVIFSILVGNRTVIVSQAASPHVTSSRYDLGAVAPLHAGATGKAILAHLSLEKRIEFLSKGALDRLTERTVTDRKQLEKQLNEVQSKGFVITRGERFPNTASAAAPVFGSNRQVIGAMAMIGPSERLTAARFKETVPVLLREAELLTKRLDREGAEPREQAG